MREVREVAVSGPDFRAVAIAQGEQLVNLQAIQSALERQLTALEAQHAKCPKPEEKAK